MAQESTSMTTLRARNGRIGCPRLQRKATSGQIGQGMLSGVRREVGAH